MKKVFEQHWPGVPGCFSLFVGSFLALSTPAQTTNALPAIDTGGRVPAKENLHWLAVTNGSLEINGLPWFKENGGELMRLPVRLKPAFRNAVWSLAQCPSGGRIRFRSDTAVLAIRLEYSSPPNMANMQAFGQTGVDLYLDGAYVTTAVGDAEAKRGKIYDTVLFDFSNQPRAEREIILYLPLYKPVKVLGVGIDKAATLAKARTFAVAKPVVFYGTSITQGGCASRAGMSYQAILGRELNLDFVNLGFSGNGLGELEVARAVSEIDASCYVLDFGANHKTGEAMREAYEPFLDYLRKQHPALPIVVMTPLYTSRELRLPVLKTDWLERRKFIEQVVRRRISAGDTNLFLVDGATLLGPAPGDGLVDGGHPNDLGFYRMAVNLAPTFRKVLVLPEQTHRIVPPVEEWRDKVPASLHSTKPDYVVFVPEVSRAEISDTGNEHFLVFDGPGKSLMTIWTQSTREGEPDQHVVFAQSQDQGKTWAKPRIIAGPAKPGEGLMASWAFPMVSKSGRIYVLYSQHVGKVDTFPHTTGQLTGIYSDDAGKTWSTPQTVPVPRTSRDNPDPSFPANCITWQKPLRLTKDGKYYAGLTRWTSKAVKKNPTSSWISHDSVVEFMRFDNLDENPEPGHFKISWFAWDKDALTVPYPGHPETSVCQEPAIVKLPDGRFFCVMRTMTGSPWWTMSVDDGQTWSQPRPLLRKDGGEPFKHPLSPCPIFDLGGPAAGSGRYALFIHNHDGNYKGFTPRDTQWHRRPIYKVTGRFEPGADQPVWFDEPEFFFDHDGLLVGAPGKPGRLDLALYSSVTVVGGKTVLWYPDRKFFLLGKILSAAEP